VTVLPWSSKVRGGVVLMSAWETSMMSPVWKPVVLTTVTDPAPAAAFADRLLVKLPFTTVGHWSILFFQPSQSWSCGSLHVVAPGSHSLGIPSTSVSSLAEL